MNHVRSMATNRDRDRRIARRASEGSAISTAVLVTPALILFTALVVIPLLLSFFNSFTDLDSYGRITEFVGVDNYVRLTRDPTTANALRVTAILTVVCTVAINAFGVFLAMMLNHRGRIYTIYRAAVFYPYVFSPIISGFAWNALLNPDGVVNSILRAQFGSTIPFLTDADWALAALIVVTVWNTVGFSTILYLAGLQSIPSELLEAAQMDGASAGARFRHITWPMLAPTTTINLVLVSIGLIRTYDLVVALTGGGPAGQTQTIAFRILVLGFETNQVGFASAGAVVLFLATAVLSAIVILMRRRQET